ncbi:MAG: 5-formyltetrahydrofolate cyclo-ligase [Polyangiaceae bacterium]
MEIDPDALSVLQARAKAHLRKRARAVRGSMSRAAIAARSAKIVDAADRLAAERGAVEVALFYPMEGRNEVDLRALHARLAERGARVAYPRANPDDRSMVFRLVSDPEAMEEFGLGIREPADDAPIAHALDLILVPALAVDLRGHRIGYGAGYYDRALAESPGVFSAVVAFDFQLAAEIPAGAHDVPARWIITDERSLPADDPTREPG